VLGQASPTAGRRETVVQVNILNLCIDGENLGVREVIGALKDEIVRGATAAGGREEDALA